MTKANNQTMRRLTKYKPFYPTTLGPNLHDVPFPKLPVYSLRPKPDPIDKTCSPGPAAYPGDHALVGKKKHRRVAKTIYPAGKAHTYIQHAHQRGLPILRTLGPAAYPFEDLHILASIYPKDKANIFSMRRKKDEKYLTASPGPAVYPRDAVRKDTINSIHPRDVVNKFSMAGRSAEIQKSKSPGPAVYPQNKATGDTNKMAIIYPADTQLPPTFKGVYSTTNGQKLPAPNAYPAIEGKHNPKLFKTDFMKKMTNNIS